MVVSKKEYKIIKTMKRWFLEEVGKPYEFIVDICGKMLEEIEILSFKSLEIPQPVSLIEIKTSASLLDRVIVISPFVSILCAALIIRFINT